MCSGCSGDYAGDFEDDSGKAELDGNQLGWERAGGFEETANLEGNSATNSATNTQSGSLRGSWRESNREICEIVVSATRIIEIRVIAANPDEFNKFRDAQEPQSQAVCKQSSAESAKYYQTHRSGELSGSEHAQTPRCRGVTAFAAGGVKSWLRWARSLLEI